MNKLWEGSLQFTPISSEEHIAIQVNLTQQYQLIELHYSYSPVIETNEHVITEALTNGMKQGTVDLDVHVEVLRNLITPALKLNGKYIGANHSFNQDVIKVGKEEASPGFTQTAISPGMLEVIFSLHAIVSERVELKVAVIGKSATQHKETHQLVFHCTELHSHTNHSDARFTVFELLSQAKNRKLDFLAITDHNTTTALDEAAQYHSTIQLIHGIEYTTFHGHFLCIGNKSHFKHLDYTQINLNNINECLVSIKYDDTLLIMAHPFDTGSPICTGCRYEYDETTYVLFDAIEVWNGDNPNTESNREALRFYKSMLNNHHIFMTSGRDWHDESNHSLVPQLMVLASMRADSSEIVRHIKQGRSELQYGYAISTEEFLPYGLTVDVEHYPFKVVEDDACVMIDSNIGYLKHTIKNGTIKFDETIVFNEIKWIIFEKYKDETIVAIGNPVFNGGEFNG